MKRNPFRGKEQKKWLIIRCVLTVLLLATLVFIYIQKGSFLVSKNYFYNEKIHLYGSEKRKSIIEQWKAGDPQAVETDALHYNVKYPTKTSFSVLGDHDFYQRFTAHETRISQFRLMFANEAAYKSQGTIYVYLEEEDGTVLGETQLDIGKVGNNSTTIFSMVGMTERLNSNETVSTVMREETEERYGVPVSPGKIYVLHVKAEAIQSDEEVLIFCRDEKITDGELLTVDGEDMPGEHLLFGVTYMKFSFKAFRVFLIALLMVAVFIWIPWDALTALWKKIPGLPGRIPLDFNVLMLWVMFLTAPLMNFILLTKINGQYLKESIEFLFTLRGVLNLMIIGCIWWLLYVITNRKRVTCVLLTLICSVFAMANYALLQFRDSPLIAADIANIRTATQVMGTYQLTFNKSSLWVITMCVGLICIYCSLQEKRHPGWKLRLVNLAIGLIWVGVFWHVLFRSSVLEDNGIRISSFKPKWNYSNNGYMLSFWVSVGMMYVEKPEGYSAAEVQKIAQDYISDPAIEAKETTEKTPNILLIMNEAYSDLQVNGAFPTNQDYMPYFRSLKDNTIRGTVHSSVYGGTTACSEFELLTGFSVQFVPYHSVPYVNLLRNETPSLTWNLKQLGYGGDIAFHPGMRTSYSRDKAYPLLGFDEFISVEDMDNPERIRAYVSDEADYTRVEEEYEKYKASKDADAPFFMLNVTIQNHGAYSTRSGIVDAGISITDDTVKNSSAEIYLNLIKESDIALERLLDYFSAVEEPTVILLYGDHQPSLDGSFYNALYALNGNTETSFQRIERRYRIPLLIWANYDIEEQEGVDISINYLASYLKQQLGMEMTGFDKYMMNLYETLPVITDIMVMDKDGNMFDGDEENPYQDLLLEYQKVQYNGFIDHKGRVEEFFRYREGEEAS